MGPLAYQPRESLPASPNISPKCLLPFVGRGWVGGQDIVVIILSDMSFLLTVEIAEPLAARKFLSQTMPASVLVTLGFLGS